MRYQQELHDFFTAHQEELLSDTASLVAINSERMEAQPGKPFGEGAAAALEKGEEILLRHGLLVKNYDNYVITGDLNDKKRKLDILAHLDVVPAGDGWRVTTPFEMKTENGRIYGRGTADDKGPAMCALYAMKAVKELGIPLRHGVRLILGSDEECGSSDIEYYFTKESSAPMSFSPDAEFPMINLEKGGLHGGFTAETAQENALPRVTAFHGGVKVNVVPNRAEAVIQGMKQQEIAEYAVALEQKLGVRVTCQSTEAERAEDSLHILVEGENTHASTPYSGKNAITALLQLLAGLPLAETPANRRFAVLSELFPFDDYYGRALGVDLEDEVSGRTTLALTVLNMDQKEIAGMFDCRASILANNENTRDVIAARLRDVGLTPAESSMYEPHHVKEDSELVTELLAAYQEVTGIKARPLAIGGGTYVHGIENGVAFGCASLEVDNRMHGADEFMEIDQMLRSCEIFAQAIIRLCA